MGGRGRQSPLSSSAENTCFKNKKKKKSFCKTKETIKKSEETVYRMEVFASYLFYRGLISPKKLNIKDKYQTSKLAEQPIIRKCKSKLHSI